ncbi:MAG: hypothetical protein IT282_11360 [Bacteroidetes bacterium]|nr:hypothetical protein [Bacteroidota bacterium]
MRLRFDKRQPTDEEEETLSRSLRDLAADDPPPQPPDPAYWQNLPIRMNRILDEATSGKAISLSWAARVAIPGIVAILSFLIGLRYYAPESGNSVKSLREVTLALPPSAVDSLSVASLTTTDTMFAATVEKDILEVPTDDAREYYIEHTGTSTLVSDLTEQELREVLVALSSHID